MIVENSLPPAPTRLSASQACALSNSSKALVIDRFGNAHLENCPRNDGFNAKLDPVSPERKACAVSSSSTQATILERKLSIHGVPRRTYMPRGNEDQFQYVWRRIYQCNRYVKYRKGYEDGRDRKGNRAEKWPLAREEAFFRAVLTYAPCGRQKKAPGFRGGLPLPIVVKSHGLGRNELIALFINDALGYEHEDELICRKKVSSHIQVLKGYFNTSDPWIAWHLGKGAQKGAKEPSAPKNYGPLLTSRIVTEFYEAPTLPFDWAGHRLLPRPLNVLPSQTDVKDQHAVLRPHVFSMDIQDPTCRSTIPGHICRSNQRDCKFDTIQNISKSQESPGLVPRRLEEVQGWDSYFPHLPQLEHGRAPDCDVLAAEAPLAVNVKQIREHCKLSIENSFRTTESGMARKLEWECRTQIYENGELRETVDDAQATDMNLKQVLPDDYDTSLLHVALRSTYWVQRLQNLAGRLRHGASESLANPNGNGVIGEKDPLRKAEQEVRNFIKGITFLQEMFIVDRTVTQQRKRVTIIYWKFRQTHKDEIGLTTWHTFFPSPPIATQRYLLAPCMPTTTEIGGLRNSLNSNDSQLPTAGVILASQSSYGGPSSQHDSTLLTSAALLDPSTYNFEIISTQAERHSEVQSISSNESAVAGAEFSQAYGLDETLSYTMPIVASSDVDASVATLSETLRGYDMVMSEDVSDACWSQQHTDPNHRLAEDHIYNLTQSTSGFSGLSSENSQAVSVDLYGRHRPILEATQHMLLAQEHEQSHQHMIHHHYQGIDEILMDGNVVEQWNTQPMLHQHHFNYQQDHDTEMTSQTELMQVTHRAHYALQDVQQNGHRQMHVHDHEQHQQRAMICMDDALDPCMDDQVIDDAAELDWDVIMPADCGVTENLAIPTSIGSPSAALILAQPQPKKPVPSLLPSAFEN